MQMKRLGVAAVIVVGIMLAGSALVSAAPQAQCSTTHVVRPGETLYSIARLYGVSVSAIAQANGIVNPNMIYVGQVLYIPTCAPVSGGVTHIVQPGETLTRIALRYGVSVWAIANANGLTNINRIYVGQRLVIPSGATPPPPPPPPPTPLPGVYPGPWAGEYFDNAMLSGTAYATRSDASINFNWGWNAPMAGIPADRFSVRWTGTFGFTDGSYRFFAKVDDGVRVYVDDVLIIDGWRDGAYRQYSADRAMTAGNHTVKVEFYDNIQIARVCVWWQQVSGPAPTSGPTPTPTVAPPTGGWLGEFFNNTGLTGIPVATRLDPWIGFDWGTNSPIPGLVEADRFSVRWQTQAYLNTDHYRFCAKSDDGVRIWVGNTLVLDEWHLSPALSYCSTYWVSSGVYTIKVEYYENDAGASIYVWWEPH